MPRRAHALIPVFVLAAALAVAPADAQSGRKQRSTGGAAIDAATQPLSDLNLRKSEIPPLLIRAQASPYNLTGVTGCDEVRTEIAALERLLGPDADSNEDDSSTVNSALQAGGNVLGGFIPFRGLVRQISGASARQAQWQSAIYAGVARRSYLKGYGKALNCATAREHAVETSAQLLGLENKPKP